MKNHTKFALLLVLLICFLIPSTAFAKGFYDDKIVAGGTFTLYSGETLDGNLLVFGGAVTLEELSLVDGDVLLMGGTISIDGRVNGNVVGFGGVVRLGETAKVTGDLTALGAAVHQAPGSEVDGQVIKGGEGPINIPIPIIPNISDLAELRTLPQTTYLPGLNFQTSPLWSALWFLFKTFLWAALAVLVVMFVPKPIERAADAIVNQPILSGGVGLLTIIVVPILLAIIALTIILIPISLLGALALALTWFLGRIAIGYEVGRRMAKILKKDWAPAVSSGLGMFLIALVVDASGQLIPCVGWIFPAIVAIIGIGGFLLTRFGSQTYPQSVAITSANVEDDDSI